MLNPTQYSLATFCLITAMAATAASTVAMKSMSNTGKSVGTVTITETKYGLLFTPNLLDLPPGIHGFHIHHHPSCEDHGNAASGHFDPLNARKHLGPYNDGGHLGDLPALYVNSDGKATTPVLAPRLKHLTEIDNHALMIHEGGDNYSDLPAKLGGGGGRMECGIIK